MGLYVCHGQGGNQVKLKLVSFPSRFKMAVEIAASLEITFRATFLSLCLFFQMLILSSKGEIIFEEENCLDVSKSYAGAPVEILKCHGMGGNQKWEHDKKSVSRLLNFSVLAKFFSSAKIQVRNA